MKKSPLFLLLLMAALSTTAQDMQYSQFYSNPVYLNPAFVGTSHDTRVAFNHRILWPSLPSVFTSTSASFDYSAVHYNSGFGFLINSEAQGTVDLETTTSSFIYSYHAVIHKTLVVQPAIKLGHAIRGFDQSKLILGDQLNFGGGIVSQDPGLRNFRLKNYWDVGGGLLVYTDRYWFGVGVDHINRPNISLLGGVDELAIRYSFHFGGRFILIKHLPTGRVPASVAPSILYKRQGNFQQLDVGASIHMQPLVLGAYYRGIPILPSIEGSNQINQDAIIFQVGFEYASFEIGYSFDIQLSKFDVVTGGGAHEFAMQYNFELPWKNRKKPRRKLHCPAFLHGLHH
ncbi:MAG: PorP/SprF family type IX secretion system membrane protein [Bacteroidota bacterium]